MKPLSDVWKQKKRICGVNPSIDCLSNSKAPQSKSSDSCSHNAIHLNASDDNVSSTTSSIEYCLKLFGLPVCIAESYRIKAGVSSLFKWQIECLSLPGVLDGKNVVLSAPTSAGKTLIAEFLILKRCLELKRKAIYILPFISVAREKVLDLRRIYGECGLKVGGFMGGSQPQGGFASCHVAVCTIEKANSMINHLMEEKKLSQICTVVVDELHMVGDPSRGYLLELLLTKILYSIRLGQAAVQVVGMSATLPNLDVIAKWLDAALFQTDFRPVPLTHCIKIGPTVYSSSMKPMYNVARAPGVTADEDGVVSLCLSTWTDGHNVIVFCPSKARCEKLASNIATQASKASVSNCSISVDKTAVYDVIEQLRHCPAGLDKTLEAVVCHGVAFHHAGLTLEERSVLEIAFGKSAIRCLVATSTLSSGVNLPARRVIIRTPVTFDKSPLNSLSYHQMAGRAGRQGKDQKVTLANGNITSVDPGFVRHCEHVNGRTWI